MKKLTKENILTAATKFLISNTEKPEQFNLKYSNEYGWDCEFTSRSETWSEGYTRWIEDADKVLKLFFSCDPDEVDVSSWDESWND